MADATTGQALAVATGVLGLAGAVLVAVFRFTDAREARATKAIQDAQALTIGRLEKDVAACHADREREREDADRVREKLTRLETRYEFIAAHLARTDPSFRLPWAGGSGDHPALKGDGR